MYTGCNKKIEPAKYVEKYTLDHKMKKILIHCFFFLNLSVDMKIDDLSVPLGA